MHNTLSQAGAHSCPLCFHSTSETFFHHTTSKKKTRTFYQCLNCKGLFKDQNQLLTPDLEKKRYEEHKNSLEDERYLRYLSDSLDFFKPYIKPESVGLDFGCGPSKGFEFLSEKENFKIQSWDKYFYPEKPFAEGFKFDFIICQEVIEHFNEPGKEFKLLLELLNDEGHIFIRTEPYPENTKTFINWYYKDDPTHVFLFKSEVFKKMEELFNLKSTELDYNKWSLQKKT